MIKKCGYCGKEIKVIPAKSRPINYCSRQCSSLYRRGKPFHTEEAKERIRKAITGTKNPANSLAMTGKFEELAHRWSGDAIKGQTGRHRAQRRFSVRPCEICGADPNKTRIHRHHVDGNTANNLESNIRFLCTKHHFEIHKLQEA